MRTHLDSPAGGQKRTNLTGFETEFDLHLAGLGAHPHIHLREGTVPPLAQQNKYSRASERIRLFITSLPLSSNMMSSSAKSS